ncbi:NAD(P)-binding protein [Thozetella sp. PMI_491]|nr:NAD(P)-binding protein [Thozetella sp. PMI_491]
MLILIAGVTGNLGHHLCRSALRDHQVRGLGRNPEKLETPLREKLESFIVSAGGQDQAAYEQACKNVDAVIVAWPAEALLIVDAQILLLREAEKAGIKRFHALSWNADWSKLQIGEMSTYDSLILFAKHAFMSSTITPCYTFVGALANTLFAVPGAGRLEGDAATWVRNGDPKENRRTIRYIGSPDAPMNWSPEEDVGDFTVALITSEYGEKGGYYRFWSDTFSPRQLKDAFETARPGGHAELVKMMEIEDIHNLLLKTKEKAEAAGAAAFQAQQYFITGLEYGYYIASGRIGFEADDADKFPTVPRQKIQDYIAKNDYV